MVRRDRFSVRQCSTTMIGRDGALARELPSSVVWGNGPLARELPPSVVRGNRALTRELSWYLVWGHGALAWKLAASVVWRYWSLVWESPRRLVRGNGPLSRELHSWLVRGHGPWELSSSLVWRDGPRGVASRGSLVLGLELGLSITLTCLSQLPFFDPFAFATVFLTTCSFLFFVSAMLVILTLPTETYPINTTTTRHRMITDHSRSRSYGSGPPRCQECWKSCYRIIDYRSVN